MSSFFAAIASFTESVTEYLLSICELWVSCQGHEGVESLCWCRTHDGRCFVCSKSGALGHGELQTVDLCLQKGRKARRCAAGFTQGPIKP